MPVSVNRVAGGTVTATDINSIAALLNSVESSSISLESRVSAVEGAAAPVQSVAGRTGAVVLAKADVGLGNVDNTADSAKPISTAQAAALATKLDTTTANATYAPISTTLREGTDLVARVLDPTVLTPATRVCREGIKPDAIVSNFQTGHGWTTAGGASWNLNNTTDYAIGVQSATGVTTGTGSDSRIISPTLSAIDFSGKKQIGLWVKVDDVSKLDRIRVGLGSPGFVSYYEYTVITNGGRTPMQNNEWCLLKFTRAQFSSQVGASPPALNNITAVRVVFTDKGTGAINFAINRFATYENTEYPTGVITFAFDDTYDGMITAGIPRLDLYGYQATIYTTVERLGLAGHATLADLHRIEEMNGADICAHAYTILGHNTQFPSLTATALDYQLRNLKAFMLREGFKGLDHFAYPGGIWDDATEAQVKKYFSSARTLQTTPKRVYPPPNRMRLGCFQPSGASTLASIQTELDLQLAHGGHVQLMFHDIVTTVVDPVIEVTKTIYDGLVDYVSTLGVPVRTERELLYDTV